MSRPLRMLELLADGRFHSGRELGQALGIARTTVWQHVQGLKARGVDIYAVRGRGYRLAVPLERLDAEVIRGRLQCNDATAVAELHVLEEVDSTNAWLARYVRDADSPPDNGVACLAEQQSAGRGRRGRTWRSPFGCNLYLSLLWRMPPRAVPGLSIAVGVSVAQACESIGVQGLALKWPNDLISAHGKVGGILVELSTGAPDMTITITGIGLNVGMPASQRAAVGQPAADLNDLAPAPVSRNVLAATVLVHVTGALARFEREGLAPVRERFAARDATRDRDVTVEEGGRLHRGRARGIDGQGALLLETAAGLVRFHGGDVSLSVAP